MPETGYIAVFLIGLLGGTHCVGMCGGIVSALTVQLPGQLNGQMWLHLSYNIGRISSYTLAGALLGGLGSVGMLMNGVLPVQIGLYVLANLMLIALGLYLTGFTRERDRLSARADRRLDQARRRRAAQQLRQLRPRSPRPRYQCVDHR